MILTDGMIREVMRGWLLLGQGRIARNQDLSFFMDILYHVSKMRYPRAKLFNDDYTVLDDSFKIGEKKSLLHLMINVRQ